MAVGRETGKRGLGLGEGSAAPSTHYFPHCHAPGFTIEFPSLPNTGRGPMPDSGVSCPPKKSREAGGGHIPFGEAPGVFLNKEILK